MLLQLALERRYGTPIRKLIDRGVLAPLGMASTFVPERGADDRALLSPQLMQRAVQGYAYDGEPIGEPGNQQGYFNFPGTGQMFSSAHDLAILMAACLDDAPVDPPLRDALQVAQREAFRVSPQHGQAMAWEIERLDGTTIVDKPGGSRQRVSLYRPDTGSKDRHRDPLQPRRRSPVRSGPPDHPARLGAAVGWAQSFVSSRDRPLRASW